MVQWLHDHLIYWDLKTWYYLHATWRSPFLDAVVPYLRNQYTWAPLYLFLLVFMPLNYGKKGFIWCLAFLTCFAMCDYISASLIKPYFHRVRPCNNPSLFPLLHLIVPRSSGYSFPSSHAANHFGLGVFMATTIGRQYKWVFYAAILWAVLVSYAQVYVGVHFPLDVFCGGLLGISIGIFMGKVFNKKLLLPDIA